MKVYVTNSFNIFDAYLMNKGGTMYPSCSKEDIKQLLSTESFESATRDVSNAKFLSLALDINIPFNPKWSRPSSGDKIVIVDQRRHFEGDNVPSKKEIEEQLQNGFIKIAIWEID